MLFFLVEAVLPSKALCQCGAAVCCRSDALGILTASLAGFVDDPLCFNPELNNRHWVILKQHSCEIPRICTWTWSSCVCCIAGLLRCGQAGLQWGWRQTLRKSVQSFGFSYISENFSLIKTSGSVPWGHRRALQDLTSAIDFLFFFFQAVSSIPSNCISCLRGNESGVESAPKTVLSAFKAEPVCAALRSPHKGDCWIRGGTLTLSHSGCFHRGDLFLLERCKLSPSKCKPLHVRT